MRGQKHFNIERYKGRKTGIRGYARRRAGARAAQHVALQHVASEVTKNVQHEQSNKPEPGPERQQTAKERGGGGQEEGRPPSPTRSRTVTLPLAAPPAAAVTRSASVSRNGGLLWRGGGPGRPGRGGAFKLKKAPLSESHTHYLSAGRARRRRLLLVTAWTLSQRPRWWWWWG